MPPSDDPLQALATSLKPAWQPPPNPRAWMFRVASNPWIDRARLRHERPVTAADPEPVALPERRADRDAASALIAKLSPLAPRAEVREHRGERILLYWYAHRDGDAVRSVARVAGDGGQLAHMRNYFFTPDVIAEVCGELGVPFRSNGYRYW